MGSETYITRRAAAEMLGVTKQRIAALIKSGKLRTSIQLDRIVVRRLDVERRLAEKTASK